MAVVDYARQALNIKIVYAGPGLSGKTTNLKKIYESTAADRRSKLEAVATEELRLLYFSMALANLPPIRGFSPRFHLWTVPGMVYESGSRVMCLEGVDGIVYVADSQNARYEQSVESFINLREMLAGLGRNLDHIPLCLQYNKRDLPDAVAFEDLQAALNANGLLLEHEACAIEGIGVFETLKTIIKLVLLDLRREDAAL